MSSSARVERIRLFESFSRALSALLKEDAAVLSWPKNKAAISHCLASRIKARQGRFVDVGKYFRAISPDVVVHDRAGSIDMAIFYSDDGYLSENNREKDKLRTFREKYKVNLVLAFAVLSSYVLIYSLDGDSTCYYHMTKEAGVLELVKKVDVNKAYKRNKGQLSLPVK